MKVKFPFQPATITAFLPGHRIALAGAESTLFPGDRAGNPQSFVEKHLRSEGFGFQNRRKSKSSSDPAQANALTLPHKLIGGEGPICLAGFYSVLVPVAGEVAGRVPNQTRCDALVAGAILSAVEK